MKCSIKWIASILEAYSILLNTEALEPILKVGRYFDGTICNAFERDTIKVARTYFVPLSERSFRRQRHSWVSVMASL